MTLTSVEICAGAGGQALGLERAGFEHQAVVEIDPWACQTLSANRGDSWNVIQADLLDWSGKDFQGVDLVAGGVPCPPFSKAGKQLGPLDERDLFPRALELVEEIRPRAVMLENVRGLLDSVFDDYRANVNQRMKMLGYKGQWKLLNARDFGVSQLRPRVVYVAIRSEYADGFRWPTESLELPPSVGDLLLDLMAEEGWEQASQWAAQANSIAPTLVGGSKKHGGPDLGPTRARKAWAALGVDGSGIADRAPEKGYRGMPKLTVRMAARLQGFPDSYQIIGKKTNAYRQVGNAFPPPVAHAVAAQIAKVLRQQRLDAVA